jgi:quercetin dioxygenase-like cupin family protein
MMRSRIRWTLAGCVALAALATAWGAASATPNLSFSSTTLAGPVTLDEVDVKSRIGDHSVKFKSKGTSDVWVVQNRVLPGGHSGWHSHPGPSIVSVVSGEATEYHGDDPTNGVVHAAGTAFVDDGDGAHLIRNEGSVDLVLIAFQILPQGATRRVDEQAP